MLIINYLGRFFIMVAFAVLCLGLWLWLSGEDITQQGLYLWPMIELESFNYIKNAMEKFDFLQILWNDYFLTYILLPPAWNGLITLFIILMLNGGILIFLGKFRKTRRRFKRSK